MSLTNTIINAMNEQDNYNQGLNMQAIWIGGTIFVFGAIGVISAIFRSIGRRREDEQNRIHYERQMQFNREVTRINQNTSSNPTPVNTAQRAPIQDSSKYNQSQGVIEFYSYPICEVYINGLIIGETHCTYPFDGKSEVSYVLKKDYKYVGSYFQKDTGKKMPMTDKELEKQINIIEGRPQTEVESPNPLEELERLSLLKDKGHLTEDEFAMLKAKILQS